MKKVIVDTNIIFSCLLNSQGIIGDLIFNSDNIFDFYSNQYMRFEIRRHWDRPKKISTPTNFQLQTAYGKITAQSILNLNYDLELSKVIGSGKSV